MCNLDARANRIDSIGRTCQASSLNWQACILTMEKTNIKCIYYCVWCIYVIGILKRYTKIGLLVDVIWLNCQV